jgi:hypothetical protein
MREYLNRTILRSCAEGYSTLRVKRAKAACSQRHKAQSDVGVAVHRNRRAQDSGIGVRHSFDSWTWAREAVRLSASSSAQTPGLRPQASTLARDKLRNSEPMIISSKTERQTLSARRLDAMSTSRVQSRSGGATPSTITLAQVETR